MSTQKVDESELQRFLNRSLERQDELTDAIRAEAVKTRALLCGLRAMARWGSGPCGGGGTCDEFSQGRRAAEAKMRKELQRLIKEFTDL
jgi:hypothetical protein